MKLMRKYFFIIPVLFLLTACWNNEEIDDEALVHGVGISKAKDQLRFNVEIIKPGSQTGQASSEEQDGGQNIILDIESDSLLNGARELIRKAKRRLYFGHTRVWIFSEELAKENSVRTIDVIRRDQMNRINSYMFITKDDPRDILDTPTLYENLSAVEITSALEQTKFISEYTPIRMYEFYRLIEGPVQNAYVPIIKVNEEFGEKITELDGTAVIKKDKMVGHLNQNESIGLTWLLDEVEGGSITVRLYDDERVSLEINKTKTKLKPHLKGEDLDVDVEVEVEGTLGDNMTPHEPAEKWFKEVEEKISEKIERDIRTTLDKLQNELETDITGIGMETYRKYPQEWNTIHSEWDEVFSNANISLHVNVNFDHKGLIHKSVQQPETRPKNIPFPFFK